MSDMDQEVFREYLAEVFESLDGLDEKFVQLEQNPADVKIVDSIFRPVHSIKGSSAFFGLEHITGFAHKLENLLDDIRKEKRSATPKVIDGLLKGTDFLKVMFDRLASGDMEPVLKPDEKDFIDSLEKNIGDDVPSGPKSLGYHLDRLSETVKGLQGLKRVDNEMLEEIYSGYVKELSENLAVVKSIAGSVGQIVQVGDLDYLMGDAGEMPQVGKLGDILVSTGEVDKDDIELALMEKDPDEMIGDVLVKKGVATEEQVGKAIEKQKQEKEAATVAQLNMKVQKTMRIDEEKVDEFMDQIGELVIITEVFNYLEKGISSIEGASEISKEFKNANLNFSELTLRLQHGLSEVRKVSIKGIFQKLPRIIRDVSTSLGKEITIDIQGEDVMLDKSLVEKIESPIIHMVRNSVDHGVEKPDVREKVGKPRAGLVQIKAKIEGELLKVTLFDDGAGLNREVLLKKAIGRGIVSSAEGEAMADKDVFDFIFHPGFSTAEKVTDISGRGVGMDVVKRAITETKGKIDIESQLGKQTMFTISVPVSTTLVTINGLVTAVGKGRFIFPVDDVMESLRPTGEEVFSVKESVEMVNIRGNIYPLLRLYDRFNLKTEVKDPKNGVCLIIEKNGKQSCVLTDRIVEQQNVVLKDLGAIFRQVKSISGGAILGDGSIGLVMNVEGLMEGV